MVAYVGQGPVQQSIASRLIKDPSYTATAADPLPSDCGTINYTLTAIPAVPSFLTESGGVLTLESNSAADVTTTPISVTVTVSSPDYSNLGFTSTMNVEIQYAGDPCESTTLSFAANLVADMVAYVGLAAVT